MVLLLVLVGWIVLSIPVGLITGLVIRRGQRRIPVHLIDLPPADMAGIAAATHG